MTEIRCYRCNSWPCECADGCCIVHGDCREVLLSLDANDFGLLLSDPPYGIAYKSGMTGHNGGTALPGIVGDEDASLRDFALRWFGGRSAIVFGTWKVSKPSGCRAVLTWEKGDHVGMGDLSLPWKPNTEEVYIIGSGFEGHRGSAVLRINAPVSWNSTSGGRKHPHEKPVELIAALLAKATAESIIDPFLGSGTTLRAAKDLGRHAIGIELEEKYCEIAARRLEQQVLQFTD